MITATNPITTMSADRASQWRKIDHLLKACNTLGLAGEVQLAGECERKAHDLYRAMSGGRESNTLVLWEMAEEVVADLKEGHIKQVIA